VGQPPALQRPVAVATDALRLDDLLRVQYDAAYQPDAMGEKWMQLYKAKVMETAAFLGKRLRIRPVIGLMTGTGLGDSATGMDIDASFPYSEIPHFPTATVESHLGQLTLGQMCEKPVMALQGRFHLYEGYSPLEVTFPIRVMQALGVKVLVLSNAAGGLNPAFSPGNIMVISDHLNLTGKNPLMGTNEDSWGDRFPDMSRVYDPQLAALAQKAGHESGVAMQSGVYAGLSGPSLETPAEVRYLKIIGADAVGFSTVQEVIAGIHAGMRVIALSIITNVHTPDAPEPASVADIIACAEKIAPLLGNIIQEVIRHVDA
jgi:purine-nucleoside phosphorylase